MILKCIAQPSLIVANENDFSGRFVFVICRDGGQKTMNKKVEENRLFLAEAKLKFIKYLDPKKKCEKNHPSIGRQYSRQLPLSA